MKTQLKQKEKEDSKKKLIELVHKLLNLYDNKNVPYQNVQHCMFEVFTGKNFDFF